MKLTGLLHLLSASRGPSEFSWRGLMCGFRYSPSFVCLFYNKLILKTYSFVGSGRVLFRTGSGSDRATVNGTKRTKASEDFYLLDASKEGNVSRFFNVRTIWDLSKTCLKPVLIPLNLCSCSTLVIQRSLFKTFSLILTTSGFPTLPSSPNGNLDQTRTSTRPGPLMVLIWSLCSSSERWRPAQSSPGTTAQCSHR